MIEKRAENIMIPEEANYQRTMKRDVEPYLRSYEKDGYIESYDKTAIYYRTYRIPQAKSGIVISHGFCEFAEKYEEVIYYFLKTDIPSTSRNTGDTDIPTGLLWMVKKFMSRIMSNMCRICIFL